MARRSAINAVADAVASTLNVSALLALAPGGVYRNRPNAQTPPYVSVGPCAEVAIDAFGTHYGSMVTVPVRAVTDGTDDLGESRAIVILDKVMELLDDAAHISPTGWTSLLIVWAGTTVNTDDVQALELGEYIATATFQIQVRQN